MVWSDIALIHEVQEHLFSFIGLLILALIVYFVCFNTPDFSRDGRKRNLLGKWYYDVTATLAVFLLWPWLVST